MPEPTGLPPARHETTDVALRPMLIGAAGVLMVLVGVGGLTFWLYPGARDPRVVRTGALSRYPGPELQPDPTADMAQFSAEQARQVNGVWWVDRARGTVHQPIGDAMRRLAAIGIADWPKAAVRTEARPAR